MAEFQDSTDRMAIEPVTVAQVPWSSALGLMARDIRREVFMVEQHMSHDDEFDADDATAHHLVAIEAGEAVGTLRVLFTPEHAKIQRVAVVPSRRGRGIGRRMMEAALALCREAGRDRLFLSAETDKVGFYEKLGFAAFGPEYIDVGLPHRAMKNY